jgi:endoglucanase
MKKNTNTLTLILALILTGMCVQAQQTSAQPLYKAAQAGNATAAQARAARLGKGMNLAVWLESSYWFFHTTTFPDVTRFTESDIKALHDLCFNTVRLPVFFEPFAGMTAPYTFDMTNQNVVRGLAYVDSVITWTGRYNMDLIIDNHLADDDNNDNLQTTYQITDANYVSRAAMIAGIWRQAAQRYGYADPDRVFFELRNEPNSVSDANLRVVYQTVIDTVRKYDHTHTLVVGNTGYYDPIALSTSTPYSDTNLLYTFHIYDGNTYPGFCFQGIAGVPATDSLTKTHISFALTGPQAADIRSEVTAVQNWSAAHGVPVWLGEFGCSTLPEVYGDDTSRCNYIKNMSGALAASSTPWAYWGGHVPEGRFTSYDGGTTISYTFSIFDDNNSIGRADIVPCFASDLNLGGSCTYAGLQDVTKDHQISVYPNPANNRVFIKTTEPATIEVYNVVGEFMQVVKGSNEIVEINISSFASGIYFAKMQWGDGTSAIRKFIKE